ncbi:MAG: UbiA family prenyltransferase [Verrucomicrobiota bacterium]|jgi:hypothetical protein
MKEERKRAAMRGWGALLELARISNLPTVWGNVLAAWLLSGGPPSVLLVVVLAGAGLVYAGGCTLNDAFDAVWDRRHRADRVIPSGRLRAGQVWLAGGLELLSGVVLLVMAGGGWCWLAVGLGVAVVVYDAWHKQSPLSVVVMGSCRWLLYLSAGAAALGGAAYPAAAHVWGGVVWVYVMVLSLVARGEALSGDRVPATRQLLWLVPVMLMVVGGLRGNWLAGLAGAGCALLGAVLLRPRDGAGGRRPGVGDWVNRLLAFLPVLDAAMLVAAGGGRWLAWLPLFAGLSLLALRMQRRFAAT